MPRTPKRQKLAKPEFVFPPGGGRLETPLPGLKLREDTGDVARWWPNNEHATNGKAAFQCNVQGVAWNKKSKKWVVSHISADTNKQAYLGYFAAFADACVARGAAVDGKAAKGTLEVVEGQLCVSHCGQATCRRTLIPATEFAPDVFTYKKAFSKYAEALALLLHGDTPATRAKIDKRRVGYCLPCRGIQHKSYAEGEHNEVAKCRRVIAEIKAKWAANGGCQVCHTCDTDVLSGDHEGRLGKDDPGQCLSAVWWAVNGGAEALREHYLGPNGAVTCKCLFCHHLEPSHSIHEGADPDDLAEGSKAKIHRDYTTKKQARANKEKLEGRGKCEHPLCCDPFTLLPRVVEEGNCHAFHFAHKDEVDKKFTIADVVNNKQSPATAIPKMDAEMPKCNLYCANCHHKVRFRHTSLHHCAHDPYPPIYSMTPFRAGRRARSSSTRSSRAARRSAPSCVKCVSKMQCFQS